MTARGFSEAADYACAYPTSWPMDLRAVIEGGAFDPPPWNVVKGRVRPRGGPAGAIHLGGRPVASWGDQTRADMVFSVTKSYVAILAGIAWDRGIIADLTAPVSAAIDHPAFAAAHNREVTWLQLLQQTSEWRGTLWGIPDTVDRDRQLAPTDDLARFNRGTPLGAPGTYWDYNDARVNALCLALTLSFGSSLADVLAAHLPPFADRRVWHWEGYGAETAMTLQGRTLNVVVGGGHWGGGLATGVERDLCLGRLVAGGGVLDGKRVLSAAALGILLAPCPLQPVYGALWWLNTERRLFPAAPASSVFATGVGMNAIWIDPALDIVAVVRWIDEPAFPGFIERVMAAVG